ncbi:hypothetical protein BZG02_08745 [Labilibaculum filiforme]|uniref:Uncharacterized protein n=1 Tax=Labilibaculum filiforme TaxID=1940526 RepID=A0A2N3HZG7_9BACT|nr:hypothetical protein BZG02_08745 [Labilibaculum filiforme]
MRNGLILFNGIKHIFLVFINPNSHLTLRLEGIPFGIPSLFVTIPCALPQAFKHEDITNSK